MKPRQITNAEEDIVEESEKPEVTQMNSTVYQYMRSIGYQYMRKDLPSHIRQYPLHPNQCIPNKSKSSNFMDIATLIAITSM